MRGKWHMCDPTSQVPKTWQVIRAEPWAWMRLKSFLNPVDSTLLLQPALKELVRELDKLGPGFTRCHAHVALTQRQM